MTRSCHRLARIALSVVVAATLISCAANSSTLVAPANAATDAGPAGETVWRARQVGWVRLVEAERGAAALDHPVQLDPASVTRVLAGLTVELPELDRTNRVFTDDEIEVLVPALVRALATAQPGQEAIFATTANRRLTLFLNKPTVNTGRVFVHNGRLNVILGHVNTGYTEQFDDAGYLRDFDPGTREGPVDIGEDWTIDSRTAGWERRREDWMTAPVQLASGPLPALVLDDTADEPGAATTASEPGTAGADTPGIVSEPAAGSPGVSSTPADGYDALKRRLEVLKELHEDGLITDKEYDNKRNELLDEL